MGADYDDSVHANIRASNTPNEVTTPPDAARGGYRGTRSVTPTAASSFYSSHSSSSGGRFEPPRVSGSNGASVAQRI